MQRTSYYLINAVTIYRIVASLVLLACLVEKALPLFKWLLAVSFFTDLIDGWLARRFRVSSVLGARLDSIGDDLTVLMGVIGLFVFRPHFLWDQLPMILVLLLLFLVQVAMALYRYGQVTAFHTWGAKLAAFAQGCFLILCFFLPQCPQPLFYVAAGITALELVEEIAMVLVLPKWRADVKGLFWIIGREKNKPAVGCRRRVTSR